MVKVIRSFQSVYVDIKSPWSLLFLNNWTSRILTSITSRGWYVRRRPCNKVRRWSRFCRDSFSTLIVLRSFRHCIRAHCRTEMADIDQTQQMIPFITREISLWLECLWIGFWCRCFWFGFFGSKLILSNNQSRATLWVLETCLIIGLLPLIIILITASLFSNTYNKASWWEELTFEGMKSTLSKTLITPWDCFRFWSVWRVERTSMSVHKRVSPFFTTLIRISKNCDDQEPITQVRRYHPTSILHPKKRFLILLNCAKLKFVSYTSNWLEQMYDFQKHTMFFQKWILNHQDLPQNQSLETIAVCIVLQYNPKQYCLYSHV